MVKTRTRSMERKQVGGYWVDTTAGITYDAPYTSLEKTITDSFQKKVRADGSLEPTNLNIYEIDRGGQGTFSGRRGRYEFHNFPYYCEPGGTNLDIWRGIEGTLTELRTKLLAESNPFRASISIPVFLFELIDVTSMLQVATSSFLRYIGSSFLNYKFSWLTLIQDIKTLATITKSIESRIKEFNSLVQNGGLRRNIHLSGGADFRTSKNYPIHSAQATLIYATVYHSYKSKVWGSVRWRPKRKVTVPLDKLTAFNLAVSNVLDVEVPDPATVWEAIPFSWLIDYFINVGDTLKAIEGTDIVEAYDICIMRKRTIHSTYHPSSVPAGITATGGYATRTYKFRDVLGTPAGISDLLSFGFVTEQQALTIAALIAARSKL